MFIHIVGSKQLLDREIDVHIVSYVDGYYLSLSPGVIFVIGSEIASTSDCKGNGN